MICDECGSSQLIETNDGFGYFYRCTDCGADWYWEEHEEEHEEGC